MPDTYKTDGASGASVPNNLFCCHIKTSPARPSARTKERASCLTVRALKKDGITQTRVAACTVAFRRLSRLFNDTIQRRLEFLLFSMAQIIIVDRASLIFLVMIPDSCWQPTGEPPRLQLRLIDLS
jgi:hypothetical protein